MYGMYRYSHYLFSENNQILLGTGLHVSIDVGVFVEIVGGETLIRSAGAI